MPPLPDGSGAGTHISMEGLSASQNVPFGPMSVNKFAASVFVSQMQVWGWNNSLYELDDQLKIGDLRGGASPFNNVNLVFLSLHCAYGTSPDYAANQCKQMYYPITSGGSGQWLRTSEMNLGGSGTNGLKWIGIYACFSLYQANWNSMKNAAVKPYNSNLHLLLGSATDCYPSLTFGKNWAQYMNYGTNGPTPHPSPFGPSLNHPGQNRFPPTQVSNPALFLNPRWHRPHHPMPFSPGSGWCMPGQGRV